MQWRHVLYGNALLNGRQNKILMYTRHRTFRWCTCTATNYQRAFSWYNVNRWNVIPEFLLLPLRSLQPTTKHLRTICLLWPVIQRKNIVITPGSFTETVGHGNRYRTRITDFLHLWRLTNSCYFWHHVQTTLISSTCIFTKIFRNLRSRPLHGRNVKMSWSSKTLATVAQLNVS